MHIEIKFAYTFNAPKIFISRKSVCNMVKNDRQVFDLETGTVNFISCIIRVVSCFFQTKKNVKYVIFENSSANLNSKNSPSFQKISQRFGLDHPYTDIIKFV